MKSNLITVNVGRPGKGKMKEIFSSAKRNEILMVGGIRKSRLFIHSNATKSVLKYIQPGVPPVQFLSETLSLILDGKIRVRIWGTRKLVAEVKTKFPHIIVDEKSKAP